MNPLKQHLPFILLTASVFIAIAGPYICGEGMFTDGLLYSMISNNMAHGKGTFWNPQMTYLYPVFRDHPPLAFALQAGYYKIFGDGIFIDKLYSLSTVVITACIIGLIWRSVVKKENRPYVWVTFLFWISFPTMTWCAVNNMLENTMMIFTTLSVFFMVKSTGSYRLLYLICAGLSVFAGFLCKGFVALFPLSSMLWLWLFIRKTSFIRCVADTLIVTIACLLPFVFLFFYIPPGLEYLELYIQKQVIASIQIAHTVNSRFFILRFLLQQLIPALVVFFGILMGSKMKNPKPEIDFESRNRSSVFIAIALSGILPIMISLKQSGFYISATLPLLAIALSLYIIPYIRLLFEKFTLSAKKQTGFIFTSGFVLIITIIFSLSFVNKSIRDRDLLSDVRKITAVVPKFTSLAGERVLYANWSLIGYLERYAGIELQKGITPKFKYLLTEINPKTPIPENFKEMNIDLKAFKLYKKSN
jgi:hypothetical protein